MVGDDVDKPEVELDGVDVRIWERRVVSWKGKWRRQRWGQQRRG